MERSEKGCCGALEIGPIQFLPHNRNVIELLLKDWPPFIVERTRESYDQTV
jgi:hypothetical protein